ncbi:hypothetical protein [Chromobacterium amazonense]|uniref:hypothetical protein n=1 Tax=Chromobacterium amazonense TaxID=1382803 RepID=UPI0021B79146|nr:hypothetical protein [Chromobacterium amazonense]MBM2884926.1 hypothetical protein [Chromobacterium amazonense]MDE1714727.1 hypothetical protein [Chromobacterium amazonense]
MVDQTDKPRRGGARKGAGRKAADGASGLIPHSIAMTPDDKAWCLAVGAARVRAIIQAAREAEPAPTHETE